MGKFSNTISRLLFILAGIGTVLLIFAPFVSSQSVLYPNSYPTAIVIYMVIEWLILIWLFKTLIDPSVRINLKNPIVCFYGLFMLFSVCSLIWSSDVHNAFWSTRSRMMGVFHMLHFFGLLLILSSIFTKWKHWLNIFWGLIGSSFIINALAISEFIHPVDTFKRAESVFGNAGHLSYYLVLLVFVSLIAFVKTKSRLLRLFALASIALDLAGIALSGTRASLLAMAAAFLVGGTFYFFWKKISPKKRRPAFAVIGLFAVASALTVGLLVSPTGRVWSRENLPKAFSRVFSEENSGNREIFWALALEGVRENPVLGWGYGAFPVVFQKFYDPINGKAIIAPWSTRVHNHFLEVFLSVGFVGFIFYLLFWLGMAWHLKRAWQEADSDSDRLIILFVGLAASAYAVQLFFLFDMPATSTVFTFLLAFAVAIYSPKPAAAETKGRTLKVPLIILIVLALSVFIAFLQYKVFLLPYQKAIYNFAGYNGSRTPEEALMNFQKSLDEDTIARHEFRIYMTEAVRILVEELAVPPAEIEELVRFTAGEMEKEAAERPFVYQSMLNSARAERFLVLYEPEALDKAKEYADKTLELSSGRPEAYQELGELAFFQGDFNTALSFFLQCLERTSLHYTEQGRILMRIAAAYAAMHDYENALFYVKMAQDIGYSTWKDIRFSIFLGESVEGEPPEAVLEYLDRAVQISPNRAELIEISIDLHHQNGDSKLVERLLDYLEMMNPERADLAKHKIEMDKSTDGN